jgi:hypothetical protein
MGYSVGKWEGDALIVESGGFNDKTWLDSFGHPHSERMRVRERFVRRDFGHLDIEITIDDAEMYVGPINIRSSQVLLPDTDLLENVCNENEHVVRTAVRPAQTTTAWLRGSCERFCGGADEYMRTGGDENHRYCAGTRVTSSLLKM